MIGVYLYDIFDASAGNKSSHPNNTVFTVMPGTSKLEKADFPVHVTVRKYDTRIIDDTTRLLL